MNPTSTMATLVFIAATTCGAVASSAMAAPLATLAAGPALATDGTLILKAGRAAAPHWFYGHSDVRELSGGAVIPFADRAIVPSNGAGSEGTTMIGSSSPPASATDRACASRQRASLAT